MGTDIHIHLEYRSCKTKHYQYGGELHGERCYGIFNTMSSGEIRCNQEMLYPVRGLPVDVSQATYKEYKDWEGDAHHASWLTTNELSIELPERLSIRLSKELSKGLSETAATIFKMIYADNHITRGDIAKKVGVSVTAVQKHVNKLKSIRLLDREGSASHGHWIIIEN